jgi:hypothetical protein
MPEMRADHYGIELRQPDEVHAEQLIAAELRRRRWSLLFDSGRPWWGDGIDELLEGDPLDGNGK